VKDLSERLAGLSAEKRALLELHTGTRGVAAPKPDDQAKPYDAAEPIAVVGMACRFPGGAVTPEAFWELLRDRVDATVPVPADRWDAERLYHPDAERPGRIYAERGGFLAGPVDRFDASFFGITPTEAESMDPQQRLLLELCWEALEYGGQSPAGLSGSSTGVFTGIGINDYRALQTADETRIDAYTGTGNLFCAAAGRISHTLGLTGPSLAVDTGCSSSLVAVHLAVRSLRSRECDAALAAAVHLMLSPEITLFLSRARALSPGGRCRTFDASADGYARGEGGGAVVLKRLADAEAAGDRILAVIRGSAVNHDGPSAGLTVPNGQAQQSLIRTALADASTTAAEVGYLEAHGTGTPLGDPIEVRAFGTVLGEGRPAGDPVLAGSVKTNIGHLEAAAGMASLIKVVLAMQHEEIPAHLHFTEPSPHIPWADLPIRITAESTPWPRGERPRVAGISSFGIGGTNAHLLVAEPPGTESAAVPPTGSEGSPRAGHKDTPASAAAGPRPLLLPLSARGEDALAELVDRYTDRLAEPGLPWAAAVRTAGVGRAHFGHRLAVLADGPAEARELLLAWRGGGPSGGRLRQGTARHGGPPRIGFVFTGQGSQYAGMGEGLYRTEEVFRRAVDECAGWLDVEVSELLRSGPELDRTEFAQPAIFAVQYGLLRLWGSWGVRPDVVLGHSAGEYAAACAAGVLRPREAARLVAERGRLMSLAQGSGGMAAVFASPGRTAGRLDKYADRLAVAAYNGPEETVVSGDSTALAELLGELADDGVGHRMLTASHAFHSPLMKPVLAPFRDQLADVSFGTAHTPVISTVTGGPLGPKEMSDPAYWLDNIACPVRFQQAAEALLTQGVDIVVELGPAPVLSALARRLAATAGRTPDATTADAAVEWLPSLARGRDDRERLLTTLTELYLLGAEIDWQGVDGGTAGTEPPAVLPRYPFQRRRHWRDTRTAPAVRTAEPTVGFPGTPLRSPALSATVFQNRYTAHAPAELSDHRLFDTVVVPGAAHLALFLSGAERVAGSGPHEAREIVFPQALALGPDQAVDIQLVMSEETAGVRRFQVAGLDPAGRAENWTVHCSGEWHPHAPDAPVPVPGAPSGGWSRRTTGRDLLDRMARAGYGLGPSLQWVRQIRHTDEGRAVAELHRPAAAADRAPLHAGLIDACFQAVMTLVPEPLGGPDPQRPTLYVPVRVDRLGLHRVPAEGPLTLHITEHLDARDDGSLLADLLLTDDTGEPCLTMAGVRLRTVPRGSLLASTDPRAASDAVLRRTAWHPTEPAAPSGGSSRLMLLAEDAPAGAADPAAELAARLRADGTDCVLTRYPRGGPVPPDVQRSVEDASVDTVAAVLPAGADGAPAAVALGLIQAAARSPHAPALRLITCGARSVTGTEPLDPEQAAAWGLAAVARTELPRLNCALLDLDPADRFAPDAVALLATELATPQGEPDVAHRGGRRHVAGTVDLPPGSAETLPPVLVPDATYVITGGLGGIGLLVAGHLVRRGARHLVLISRRSPDAAGRAAVARLRDSGVEVLVVQADVGDLAALRDALARAESLPPIRGVVHAAGVLDDGVLVQQDPDRLHTMAAPKLGGARNLRRVLDGRPLDFLLLFSSAAALLGSRGQGGYAAANAQLDAYACELRRQGVPATSVAWAGWQGVGMAAGLDARDVERLAGQGLPLLSPDQALAALDRVLTEQVPPYLAVLAQPAGAAQVPPPAPAVPPAGSAIRAVEPQPELHPRPDSFGPYRPPGTQVERTLAELWEAAFRITPIGAEDDFFTLGGDSILALTLIARARQAGLSIKESDIFEFPTVRGLAAVSENSEKPATTPVNSTPSASER